VGVLGGGVGRRLHTIIIIISSSIYIYIYVCGGPQSGVCGKVWCFLCVFWHAPVLFVSTHVAKEHHTCFICSINQVYVGKFGVSFVFWTGAVPGVKSTFPENDGNHKKYKKISISMFSVLWR